MANALGGKITASLAHITLDLLPQRLQRLEALFRAKVVQEIDLDVPAIQIALKIEQMHFKLLADALHGRTATNVGDARPELQARAAHQHRIDPVDRSGAAV